MDLQVKLTESNRALTQVLQLIAVTKMEQKRGAATIEELNTIPSETPSFKSVGRMFLKEPLPSLNKKLHGVVPVLYSYAAGMMEQVENQITSLETKRDYLKKQVKQDEDNLNEVIQQLYKKPK